MANQYNNAIPAVTNQIAADIPDIQETLGFEKDCLYALCTGWSNTATTNLKVNLVHQFPRGGTSKMLQYANTAWTGWTLDTTTDDKVVFITKGSGAGGETGGGAHSTGSWTLSHTHPHNHQWHDYIGVNSSAQTYDANGSGVWTTFATHGGDNVVQIAAGYAGGLNVDGYTTNAGTAAVGATWRPAAYCFILASLD